MSGTQWNKKFNVLWIYAPPPPPSPVQLAIVITIITVITMVIMGNVIRDGDLSSATAATMMVTEMEEKTVMLVETHFPSLGISEPLKLMMVVIPPTDFKTYTCAYKLLKK